MFLYGHSVNQLARSFTKKLNEKINPLGLYSSQWGIVLYLHKKKKCTQTELYKYLGVEAPTITRTLSRMEQMGFIIRIEGKDKRERYIELTEKACDMFPKWQECAESVEIEATNNISQEEMAMFNNILEKIINNLN